MGKYVKRKKSVIKPVLVLASVVILLLVATFGTLAYLSAESTQAINTFTPSRVTSSVVETFENNIKKDVSIQNTGDTEAFIRASVVVTWQRYNETTGTYEVYSVAPKEIEDYKINWYDDEGEHKDNWFKGSDEFYYFKDSVKPGDTTTTLICEVEPYEGRVPEGYNLCVEILSSAIQYVPEDAVEDAWPAVKVVNGKLTAASAASAVSVG